jgi:hypothetical protein
VARWLPKYLRWYRFAYGPRLDVARLNPDARPDDNPDEAPATAPGDNPELGVTTQ